MTTCSKCGKPKEDSEFANRKDGKKMWCKECNTQYCREWYEKNSERHCKYVSEHSPDRKVHTCKHCGRTEPEVSFYRRKDSKSGGLRFICRECEVVYRRQFPKHETEAKRGYDKKRKERESAERKKQSHWAKYIVKDSKRSDKKKNHENDLTIEFVENLIANGCIYCGETELRMTLDRINNDLGHLQTNVNASCRRCNWSRRDMPYAAWIRLVPEIRKIAEEGLFGDWHPGPWKHSQVREEHKQPSLF